MKFEPGTLVSARGREWLVLPGKIGPGLLLKPLGGADEETILVFPELEKVVSAEFALPDPKKAGDARSCALLRDAVRLGLAATTGPFRSFGNIAARPASYQLVPLLMALKQGVIRLLIADDVGIGKTIEALLIAREMLDRGEIHRIAVLCPAQLAEQWQREMAEKFHLEAVLVLPSTTHRLEKGLSAGTSIFEHYPFTIVSLDYIKSDRRRAEFLRACPEFVIVDEAHTCASGAGRSHKQSYELIASLAENPERHMVFLTATPHCGKTDIFRSLLAFLDPQFANLPEDLAGPIHEKERRKLAEYFVQRRRGHIRKYLDETTPFPVRKAIELTWRANAAWQELFQKCFSAAKDHIEKSKDKTLNEQRMCWWSALALLRAVSSSPEALLAAVSGKIRDNSGETPEQIDAFGLSTIFDQDSEALDIIPAAKGTALPAARWKELEKLAENLLGKADPKLQGLVPQLRKLLKDGFSPVIFCRYIPTVQYLAKELRQILPGCRIEAISGQLAPAEREEIVLQMGVEKKKILVCTDCLSEGINLQDSFDAVIHYDLAWNPTRHEQREGRVDRFGQNSPEARIITWWGEDNPVDGLVLDVLLRKHESIRKSLGISVPVPVDSDKVFQTLLQKLLFAKKAPVPLFLPGLGMEAEKEQLAAEWDRVKERHEKRSKTLFAQETIKTEEVVATLKKANEALGTLAVEDFVSNAWELCGGVNKDMSRGGRKIATFSFDEQAGVVHPGLPLPENGREVVFRLPAKRDQICLVRSHPLVRDLAAWLAGSALDSRDLVARCGAMRTTAVSVRATLLLLRLRFAIETSGKITHSALAEECCGIAFSGAPGKAVWLDHDVVPRLVQAAPTANVTAAEAEKYVGIVREGMAELLPHILQYRDERAGELLRNHRDIRDAANTRNLHYRVEPRGNPDILGIFVYLPDMVVA